MISLSDLGLVMRIAEFMLKLLVMSMKPLYLFFAMFLSTLYKLVFSHF